MLFSKECGLHNTKLWTRDVMPCVSAKKLLPCFSLVAISADEIAFSELASILNTFNSTAFQAHMYEGDTCLLTYYTRRLALISYRKHHMCDNDFCVFCRHLLAGERVARWASRAGPYSPISISQPLACRDTFWVNDHLLGKRSSRDGTVVDHTARQMRNETKTVERVHLQSDFGKSPTVAGLVALRMAVNYVAQTA